jgi:hypothetical protein
MSRRRSAAYWAPYLRAHVVYNLSPLLSRPFLDATFGIDAALEGVEEAPPRWQKCVSAVKHALPGTVDRLYVGAVLPAQVGGAQGGVRMHTPPRRMGAGARALPPSALNQSINLISRKSVCKAAAGTSAMRSSLLTPSPRRCCSPVVTNPRICARS